MSEIASLVDELIRSVNADRGTVWVRTYSKNRFVLQPFYMSGLDQSMINAEFLKLDLIENFGKGQQIIDTLELSRPLVLNSRTNEYVNKIEGKLQYIVESSLTIPIKFCDTTIGVLQLLNSKNERFSIDEMNRLQQLDALALCVVRDCDFVDIIGDLDFMITHFGTQAARKLRTIWNLLNMLKTLVNYEDSNKGRLLYKKEVFDVYNVYIAEHLMEIEKELHKLYKYSEDKSWSIAKYLNNTFGRIKDDTKMKLREDFADVEIYMDILSRDYDSLEVYLDDYNVEEFEKNSILKLIKRNHNVRDFYNQTRSSMHIISVDNIEAMLGGHSAKVKVTNDAIQTLLDNAINQLLKFQKYVNTISYFGESSEYRFLVRNLDYFRDFCEVIAEQRFKLFHYANKKFEIAVNVELINDCEFETDAPKLCRVIESLMTNAAEELCEKELSSGFFEKRLSVKLWCEASEIFIAVKDNGRGVNQGIKTRIFEKYFTFGKSSGSGIGLAFAKDVVEKGLHGEVYLGENTTSGAEFVIKFIKGTSENPSKV